MISMYPLKEEFSKNDDLSGNVKGFSATKTMELDKTGNVLRLISKKKWLAHPNL